jgi:uncharacterized protein YceK
MQHIVIIGDKVVNEAESLSSQSSNEMIQRTNQQMNMWNSDDTAWCRMFHPSSFPISIPFLGHLVTFLGQFLPLKGTEHISLTLDFWPVDWNRSVSVQLTSLSLRCYMFLLALLCLCHCHCPKSQSKPTRSGVAPSNLQVYSEKQSCCRTPQLPSLDYQIPAHWLTDAWE